MEGQSGHNMEDYHVAEYRKKKGHAVGLFAIFDGHLGDRVPSYLRDNLFNNILEQVYFNLFVDFFPLKNVFVTSAILSRPSQFLSFDRSIGAVSLTFTYN